MKEDRDYNLDLLKAIAIVFVLLWHLQPIRLTPIAPALDYNVPAYLIHFFNNSITLVAVPLFYLVSTLLFFKNSKKDNYFKRRILHILSIYLFWAFVQVVVNFVAFSMGKHFNWGWPIKPQPVWKTVIMGGPALPIVGDSVFYFLFNLLLLTCIAFVYSKIREDWRAILSYVAVLISIIYFYFAPPIPYWRIDNFVVYIPLADILLRKKNTVYLYVSLALYVAFVVYETRHDDNFAIYARNSILFGALFLYLLIKRINLGGLPKSISSLSTYSLGIYALHKYWMLIFVICVYRLFAFLNISNQISLGQNNLSTVSLLAAFLAFLATILTIYVMGLSKYFRRFV